MQRLPAGGCPSGNVDRVLEDRADAVSSSATGASTAEELVVPSADLDPGIVIYDAADRPVVGNAASHLQDTFDTLSTSTTTQFRTVGSAERARVPRPGHGPFLTPGGPTSQVAGRSAGTCCTRDDDAASASHSHGSRARRAAVQLVAHLVVTHMGRPHCLDFRDGAPALRGATTQL